ncbi:hypothetical protein [Micromonospora sp. NBC_00421]|uniref:hypothetical protein n=1 Tax=Micromonospora sp. NBC_00421 TaxID=2975976 RepID=UPI002E216E9F
MADYVVEVNEGVVEASRQGVDWWIAFRVRFKGTGRIVDTKPACVIGGVCEVVCDSRADAEWLAASMVQDHGLPKTAVRVKTAAVCRG